MARVQRPADAFATATPANWARTVLRALTEASACTFQEFDLYWLGPSYGGLPLSGSSHDEAVRAAGSLRGAGRASSIAVVYAPPVVGGPRAPGQLSLIQRPPLTADETASRDRPGALGKGEPLTVAGQQATLYTTGGGTIQLELDMGRTFATIDGVDRGQVLQAAQALRRLN